jgi:molybdate transport system substrate-binding protein
LQNRRHSVSKNGGHSEAKHASKAKSPPTRVPTSIAPASASTSVAVRPKPDIGTPEEMKQTLLTAKSIAFNRDGASCVRINEMVEYLGTADKVKPKFILEVGSGQPQRDVAAGKAELVITLIPEIADSKGLDLVGPLPRDLQSYINISAGVAVNSRNVIAARPR